jgi:hypothetical protein
MERSRKEEYEKKLRKRRSCRQRYMERLGCQITHIYWKCLRRKKKCICSCHMVYFPPYV